MILVAGGTGRLGTALVRGLVSGGQSVRVITRDPRRAAHLADLPVEVVVADVRSSSTLSPALAGVDVAVSAVHGFAGPGRVSPRTVDRDGNVNLVDAAAGVGASVVMVSVVGAAPDARMSLFRAKYAAEQYLRSSAAPWTIVRSTAFLETWAEVLSASVVPGRGDNRINFVSASDVAALVQEAVLDPTMRGRVLEISGPDDLTLNELSAALGAGAGSTRTTRHVPRTVLRVAAPFSRRARAALTMDTTPMTTRDAGAPDVVATTGPTDATEALRLMADGHADGTRRDR